ncbi:hypothetical protein PCC6912_40320 [Chlorogloeopsis fritschii PCC 6912]|uniref:Uncharacterized protein n=1 Tax=Chlorogloeopsis fritschii PCC 6912 TaxID=211165 RepID=A0A433N6G0_CHLFR|nr:hypothetical protein [Chlorogloeopsis fritschii]RUR77073.1 hypothetical protein PCC6912_40320 [Chlorogloeopsis fritschii PCC 6912]
MKTVAHKVEVVNQPESSFDTSPWKVLVNGVEVHRANTRAKCEGYAIRKYSAIA